MPIIVKGTQRELIPAGNYVSRCYQMIHLGTMEENIMGEFKTLNKVRITWELPTELRVFNEEKGEQPMVISQDFNMSLHEKANLRKFLESWRGKGFTEEEAANFDITKLLGVPCMINIIHKTSKSGTNYATISSGTPLPKGYECPAQINESFYFNFEENFNEQVLDSFPEFIKDRIKNSDEYKAMISPEDVTVKQEEPEHSQESDDLPF